MPNSIEINSLSRESPRNFGFKNKLLDYWLSSLMVQAALSEAGGSSSKAGFGRCLLFLGGAQSQGRVWVQSCESLCKTWVGSPGIACCWSVGADGKWRSTRAFIKCITLLSHLIPQDTSIRYPNQTPADPPGLLPASALQSEARLVPGGIRDTRDINTYGCRYGVVVQSGQRPC